MVVHDYVLFDKVRVASRFIQVDTIAYIEYIHSIVLCTTTLCEGEKRLGTHNTPVTHPPRTHTVHTQAALVGVKTDTTVQAPLVHLPAGPLAHEGPSLLVLCKDPTRVDDPAACIDMYVAMHMIPVLQQLQLPGLFLVVFLVCIWVYFGVFRCVFGVFLLCFCCVFVVFLLCFCCIFGVFWSVCSTHKLTF